MLCTTGHVLSSPTVSFDGFSKSSPENLTGDEKDDLDRVPVGADEFFRRVSIKSARSSSAARFLEFFVLRRGASWAREQSGGLSCSKMP